MTITLYLQKETLLRDLETLKGVFNAKQPEVVQSIRNYLPSLNISSSEFTRDNVIIQVSPEEFALIGIFNGGL
jgi:hypothetical protein